MRALLPARLFLAALCIARLFAEQPPHDAALARAANEPAAANSNNEPTSVRHALREFDRFLDHHPRLEEELRLHPAYLQDAHYQRRNPALRDFLAANPRLPAGLDLHPHYFLHRALLREATAPLRFFELTPLMELLERQPALAQMLSRKPDAIRDPAFLADHDELHALLRQHPPLDRAFLPPSKCLTHTD